MAKTPDRKTVSTTPTETRLLTVCGSENMEITAKTKQYAIGIRFLESPSKRKLEVIIPQGVLHDVQSCVAAHTSRFVPAWWKREG